jgi:D-alanyl-lipoteichoic acid acyltransferase DltB (MBOAT superfamily)
VVFPTIQFAVFFVVVLALSWALMPHQKIWKPFILACSALFYAAATWRWVGLLAAVIAVNQLAAFLISRTEDERRRKWLVGIAVALDLGLLGVYKYYGFFATELNDLLANVSLDAPLPLLAIALPVGISFFTFQAISYVVDVHRRLLPPAHIVDFALYLSFFPHLVAGPIVRAREFIPQLARPRNPRDVALGAAVTLIMLGLVKKVVLADYLAREVVDPVFAVPVAYSAQDAILAAYAYTAQIYCDFSGYTDIAIGLALLMGFVFPQNFDSPYRAASFREFWRRWHITLSRFLRDFLYIPLGGSRGKGRFATQRNLMITMVLGGLWHGAAWPFVLWGALHGAGLATEHTIGRERFERIPVWLRWLVVFHLVVAGWILFRSPELSVAGDFFGRLDDWTGATLWSPEVLVAIVVVIGLQIVPARRLGELRLRVERLHPLALGAALAIVIMLAAATIPSQGVPPFIYFQF